MKFMRTVATFFLMVLLIGFVGAEAQSKQRRTDAPALRPQGSCDIYLAAGNPCVAAHSTTRALYSAYDGPLYQVIRQSDSKTAEIMVVRPAHGQGGYADAPTQDAFCANTYCWISKVYDQSPKHNDLSQAPRGGFSGPALGGMDNLPLADRAPVTIMGHKVYGIFIEPGTGLRIDDAKGTAVDDQAEGQYWVINGHHFNGGCCFDYGNAETDSRDDDNGTMETAYFGDTTGWIHGNPPGPWIETDQENNLVGCVNTDASRLCAHLPDIHWRFVTAMAKGQPHRWASLGGDAQAGPLTVMFDGQRVNSSYDPMRKQGAILLGNGGDNSNSSQGTFYEGAVTAAGTFPSDATDQLVQANIVAAAYAGPRLNVSAPGAQQAMGQHSFSPGETRDVVVAFTNTDKSSVKGVILGLSLPGKDWTARVDDASGQSRTFAGTLAPGASIQTTFAVKAGQKAFNGDLIINASWSNPADGLKHTEVAARKVRNTAPIKINSFRVGAADSNGNTTNSFVELYNAGTSDVDLSGWSMTGRPAQQAIFSSVQIPRGTTLKARGFYRMGLSTSGLAVPAQKGSLVVNLRDVNGMSVGDTIMIGTGPGAESRRIASLGTAASMHTSLWQPLPDGPITLPAGSTSVPVQSISGFKVGQKIALGYGVTGPFTGTGLERYEIRTVTNVGTQGTQAYLAVEAPVGASMLQVTDVADLSAGDHIRLDIDSKGHGIEDVTIKRVGTKAMKTNLTGDVAAGSRRLEVFQVEGLAAGDKIVVGMPASTEIVTVTAVERDGNRHGLLTITPGLVRKHGRDEWVVAPGTGLELATPLRYNHAANMPFSARGTGISFAPATSVVHVSDEPVMALGSGLTLDQPLAKNHDINEAVQDPTVKLTGEQAERTPDLLFGGPELQTRYLLFNRVTTLQEGSLVLRDAAGMVADSLNYGGLADPWAAEGDQSVSGEKNEGCFVAVPRAKGAGVGQSNQTFGRLVTGVDTDSNCNDFGLVSATAKEKAPATNRHGDNSAHGTP